MATKEYDIEPMKALYGALKSFQSEAPIIDKNKEVKAGAYSYKYADLAHIVDKVRPILNKHGLAVSQMPTTLSGEPALKTIIMHEEGGMFYDVMKLAVQPGADAQKQGSAISYARRYALSAALGIVTDDDIDAQDQKGMQPATKRLLWDTVQNSYAENNEGAVPNNQEVLSYIHEMTGKPPAGLYEEDAQALIKLIKK